MKPDHSPELNQVSSMDPIDEAIDALMRAIVKAGITPEAFGSAFDRVRPTDGSVPRYASIRAASQNDEALAMESAARRAHQKSFFLQFSDQLTRRIPMAEAEREALASGDAVKTLVGEHQAIFQDEGLQDVAWARVVTKVAPVTALVRDHGTAPAARGTGFLIGPDLLLTAAHVVWSLVDYDVVPPKEHADSSTRLTVEFHDPLLADSLGRPRVVRVVRKWLFATSPPCGKPPNLTLNDVSLAKANLDFALIRLAERIGDEVPFLDIADPPAPHSRDSMAIVGHTGGSACKFHVHWLNLYEQDSQRLQHKANTASGMSGGPCLTVAGRVLGLHEGVARDNGGVAIYNRSVYLGPVYAKLKAAFPAQARDRLSWLSDEDGAEPLRRVFRNGGPPGRTRHPVFGRAEFQEWIDEARAPRTARPVALISGADGAGKSFSVAILRNKLRGSSDVLVHFPPEICRSIRMIELLSRLFACISDPFPRLPDTAGLRPEAGILRHDIVPNAFDELERTVLRDGDRRLWVSADFGRDQGWLSGSADTWTEFLSQAAKRPWMRVVVIGIAPSRQADFLTLLSSPERPFTEQIRHVDAALLADFVNSQIAGQLDTEDKAHIRGRLIDEWTARAAGIAAEKTTIEAVRCAIRFKDIITQHGRVSWPMRSPSSRAIPCERPS